MQQLRDRCIRSRETLRAFTLTPGARTAGTHGTGLRLASPG